MGVYTSLWCDFVFCCCGDHDVCCDVSNERDNRTCHRSSPAFVFTHLNGYCQQVLVKRQTLCLCHGQQFGETVFCLSPTSPKETESVLQTPPVSVLLLILTLVSSSQKEMFVISKIQKKQKEGRWAQDEPLKHDVNFRVHTSVYKSHNAHIFIRQSYWNCCLLFRHCVKEPWHCTC